MAQSRKDSHGLQIGILCRCIVSLLRVDVSQIGQRPRRTPRVSDFTKYSKGALIEGASSGDGALFARDVPLLVQRPRRAGTIAESLKNAGCFIQCPSSTCVVAANFDHVGEVMQTTRN